MSMDRQALGIKPDRRPECRIRMGRKLPGGGVGFKDRFTITLARASGVGQQANSVLHPAFAAFNRTHAPRIEQGRPVLDDNGRPTLVALPTEPFRTLHGNLVHGRWESPGRTDEGCAWTRYGAQKLPGNGGPPDGRPACSGDGRTAERWNAARQRFEAVSGGCPGDGCEFRQGDSPPCKRASTLVFQLRWPDAVCQDCAGRKPAVESCETCNRTGKVSRPFPACTALIESSGPWSFATMQWWGWYTQIEEQWRLLGGEGTPDLYSLPIRLVLIERTIPARRARVWVPELHSDLPPGQTLQEFLAWRAKLTAETRPLLDTAGRRLALPGTVDGARAAAEDIIDVEAEPVPPPQKPHAEPPRGGR